VLLDDLVAGDKMDFNDKCEIVKVMPTNEKYATAQPVDMAYQKGASLCQDMSDMKVKDKCEQPREMPCGGDSGSTHGPSCYQAGTLDLPKGSFAYVDKATYALTPLPAGETRTEMGEVMDDIKAGERGCVHIDGTTAKIYKEIGGATAPTTAPKFYAKLLDDLVASDGIEFNAACDVIRIPPTDSRYAAATKVTVAFVKGTDLCLDSVDHKVKTQC
jgi:hypothetical protein